MTQILLFLILFAIAPRLAKGLVKFVIILLVALAAIATIAAGHH